MSHVDNEIIKNLSVDCVVFGFSNFKLEILLIKRKRNPEKGRWALPGGFILPTETLDEAAVRILEATSNVKNIYLEQVHTFGELNRFPERRVITIAYFALIDPDKHFIKPGIDTSDAKWFDVEEEFNLPFDHNKIFNTALQSLRQKIRVKPVGFELLPNKFTLTQLQTLYESILGKVLDKRNFRKKILGLKLLTPLEEFQQGVAHRAPRLYSYDVEVYNKLKEKGFIFEV